MSVGMLGIKTTNYTRCSNYFVVHFLALLFSGRPMRRRRMLARVLRATKPSIPWLRAIFSIASAARFKKAKRTRSFILDFSGFTWSPPSVVYSAGAGAAQLPW